MKTIQPLTLVVLDVPEYNGNVTHYENLLGVPNNNGTSSLVLCLGEVVNMLGHYAFLTKSGTVVYGLHSDIFRMPTDDEL